MSLFSNSLLRVLPLCLSLLAGDPAFARTAGDPLAFAERALQTGHADAASGQLQGVLATQPTNGTAHLLLCRVFLSERLLSQAVEECQAAVANGLDHDSAAQDWAGRAEGRQAEHAGMIQGLKLALQVHTAFEAAVRLDPRSEAACADLGEYYTAAPAIVGGGAGKALALADRSERPLPGVAHRIRAMVAERDRNFQTAEREFRLAVDATHAPGAMVDLAAYYDRRHDRDKAVTMAREVLRFDPQCDADVVEAAGILDAQRETAQAITAIRSYLAHGAQSDVEPAFRVHTLLADALARSGDKTAARAEYVQALSLASRYAPAQKGLGAL